MSEKSDIQWTDATWNPVRGCVKVSPGCAHCYAETFAERFRGVKGHPYEQGFDLRLVPEKLDEPLRWKKPRRVFVNSMSDLFQDGVSDAFILDVLNVIRQCPQHTFQLLTKRAERMRAFMSVLRFDYSGAGRMWLDEAPKLALNGQPISFAPLMKNLWLGVSVENQRFADERIPLLLQTPAGVRFVSYEPALEGVDFGMYVRLDEMDAGLDWIIVGGESGREARPFNLAWARAVLRLRCGTRTRVFMKQLGAEPYEGTGSPRIGGSDARLYELDIDPHHGGDMVEWPEDLRVREFPGGVETGTRRP